ncbi:uncharacterized protein BDZ83DRAFT_653071 [Colletotrichum acutatum]|uniref:Uncharacterized protein n=1 Tax=Glomerella acutata TaxID=27357 RepID=A0AAD8XG13_GLOAC|nr:uncharacterized protein BDZ83DRAFT_653071 [Colletotrichum acutatum]KAK1723418.1 hypothetical protein BDZ83DRAFT_653071 [Colletotrichum acutatum]
MGFLRFFSSKRSSDKSSNGIKAQAYDATTASLPPLLGTYPVAGNGPTNVFEDLQRSHHKMSETNLSLAAGSEASAPAPPVLRFRDSSLERPSSAPGSAAPPSFSPSPPGRWGRDSSRGPPLSFRKPRLGSLTSTTSGLSGLSPAPKRNSNSPAIPFEGDPFRPPTAPFTHNRHLSMQSTSTAAVRGFIDLLDAQSEIKPSGFQSRVKASGARDYGEDVADRNIGENGVDLESDKVQAFYATNGGSPRDRHNGAFAAPARAQFGDKEQTFKPPRRHDSLDNEARTKSLTSASLGQVPFRTNMFNPESSLSREPIMESVSETIRGRRRQSLGAYIPTTPSNTTNGRTLSLRKSTADASGSPSARQHKRRSTLGGEAPLNELGIFTPGGGHPDPSLSPKMSQKPTYLVKHNYSLPVQQRPKTSSGLVHTESYQAFLPSILYRLLLFTPGRSSANTTCLTDVMRSGHSWLEAPDDSYLRSKSNGAPFGKGKLDEIYEHVPMRTSSLRHWSISSATPTMSSTSSFQRPHSRHTTTTTVDLATMSSFLNDSCSSLHSGTGDHASFCTALESALPSPITPAKPGDAFNIDDYLSSDDDIDADSFITTRKRDSAHSGGHEEGLLFSDEGYGEGGLQLPGLFDSLSNIPDPDTTSPERFGHKYSLSNPSGRLHRRFSLDPRIEAPMSTFDEGDNDAEDEDDGLYDIPMRSDLALGRRGTRRISALGTMYQSIEEEKDEKVDVRAAVRLRKEDKARQRALARFSRVQHKRVSQFEVKQGGSE